MAAGSPRRVACLLICLCLFGCGKEAPAEPDSDGDGPCVDEDGDLHGEGCSLGPDCDDSAATGVYCDSGCFTAKRDADNDGHPEVGGELFSICAFMSGYSGLEALDDCDDSDGRHWSDCGACSDTDDDGFGTACDYGADCDPSNPNVWSRCDTCRDADHDGAFVGCNVYATVNEDCDERDPLTHPGAVDFPDNARAEDCQGFSEPNATSGDGIYVSSDCGDDEQGTFEAPFCTLTAALAASYPPGSSVFVAAGQYAMPDTVSSVRIFGGYATGWFLRSPSRMATSFTSTTGVVLENVLIHNATLFYTSDCEGCSALTVGNGGAQLADFDIAVESAAATCTSIAVRDGDAVLVRAKVLGSDCVSHRAVVQDDHATVIWQSEIQAGSPGNVTQQPVAFRGTGNLVVGESVLHAEGAHATAIQTFAGADIDIRAARISAAGVEDVSQAIEHAGSSLRIVNSLLEVTSSPGTAFGLGIDAGTATILHTNIATTGVGATAIRIGSSGVVRLINDVFAADGSAGSYGINVLATGSQVTVQTDDFQVSGAGATCAMLVEGICEDPVGVDGNIVSSGCDTPSTATCTRIDAGTALASEIIPSVDIDYEARDGWDIGAYELP